MTMPDQSLNISYTPTDEDVVAACRLYRDDFDSLSCLDQSLCFWAARDWLKVWREVLKDEDAK